MHCKSCNAPLERELVNRWTGNKEDLCSRCLADSLQMAYNTNYETEEDDPDLLLDIINWEED